MKEIKRGDDTPLFISEDGGLWIDSGDVNRLLLHAGLPGLESMGGKPNVDEIGDLCPKDNVDLIIMEGGDKGHPLSYGICEVCGGMWLELGLDAEPAVADIEAALLDFFRGFRRPAGPAARSARA